jgi:hypothetical protein
MANNTPEMTYSLKYGGIEEVVAGEGKPVNNLEDLYASAADYDLIIIPRVVGVHQTIKLDGIEILEDRTQEIVQRFVNMKYGSEDGVDGTLISLVYDSEVMDEAVLRTIISKQDVLRRLKLTGYKSVPDFTTKPIISQDRITKLLSNLESKKTKKAALNLLEREVEYFNLNRGQYGLTRIESLNYVSLDHLIREMKDADKREKAGDLEEDKKSSIITDPSAIKITELFQDLIRRYLRD